MIPLIKARRVRAPGQIPPLHSWKRGTGRGTGWAQVQGTEAQADLAIAQSPPIAMDGGQGHGKEPQPSLHNEALARKQQGSRVLGQELALGAGRGGDLQESPVPTKGHVLLDKSLQWHHEPKQCSFPSWIWSQAPVLNTSKTSSAGQVRTRQGQSLGVVGCKYSLCNSSCIHILLCAHGCFRCWKLLMFLTAFS